MLITCPTFLIRDVECNLTKMKKLDVEHFLGIYQIRKRMQENGVTNPSDEIKKFTREFVEKLLNLPLDEEIKIENHSFFDSKGNLISKIPMNENE